MSSAENPAPGWYENPQGLGLRWWDGAAWTEHVHVEAAQTSARAAAEPDSAAASAEAEALLAMYSATPPPATADPSYSGYKAMLVMLGLAIVAIVAALLLIGGGDEGDGAAADASAEETAALARAAHTAAEAVATGNGGSYAGVTPEALVAIDPSLAGADLEVSADATSYTLTVTDPAGEASFTVTRDASGVTSFACRPEGVSGCPPGGEWGGAEAG